MRHPVTEQFLTNGGWEWVYVERIEFSDIDITTSKENPSRMLRRVNEDIALNYGIAMEAGDEFPAIVLLAIIPDADEGVSNSISLIITQVQKAQLRDRGFTDAQISDMTPADAHQLLGLLSEAPAAHTLAFKYLIATGVHRVHAAMECINPPRTGFDAYIVTEQDRYRQDTLVRQLNTIEGQGVTIRDRVLQLLQLHESYPDHSLRQLAKEWRLSYTMVKNAANEKAAARRAARFGFEFSKNNKLGQRHLLALNTIHSDPVFEKALHFVMLNETPAVDVEEMVKEIRKTRDESSALAVVEGYSDAAGKLKIQAQAKHGKISPAPSTKFLSDAKRLARHLDKGIDQLYLSAYPKPDQAAMMLEDLIANLTRAVAEFRRYVRRSAARHEAEQHVGLH